MQKDKKKKTWTKPRHRVVTALLRPILGPFCRMRYGIRVEPFREQGSRNYLVLMNHQTPFDQFFVSMAFKGPVYFLATEDIFSLGWVSSLIRYLVEPIPIKKQTTDLKAVMNCLKVAREGGTVALAPEGNRTYSGRTEYMKSSIVPLAKKMKLPIALFRIEGGYGVQPRWSDVIRRGKMRGYVARVIEPEDYKAMSDDALFEAIRDGLFVDEAKPDGEFRHKKQAEYLERAVYVCPFCGLAEFESKDDIVACKSCGRQIRHLPTKELKGVGFDFPFPFVGQWYDYQKDYINALDLTALTEAPLFRDKGKLSEVHLYKHKELLYREVDISLYGDRVLIRTPEGEINMPFAEMTASAVLGRNKLNIYFGDHVYQIYGGKRFNAMKYVNFFHRYQNITRGEKNGEFLGL